MNIKCPNGVLISVSWYCTVFMIYGDRAWSLVPDSCSPCNFLNLRVAAAPRDAYTRLYRGREYLNILTWRIINVTLIKRATRRDAKRRANAREAITRLHKTIEHSRFPVILSAPPWIARVDPIERFIDEEYVQNWEQYVGECSMVKKTNIKLY